MRNGLLYFNGDVAEVVVYDRVLDAAERREAEGFLKGKYSLGGAGAPRAPVDLRVYGMGSTRASLAWDGDDAPWTVFEIERRENDAPYEKVAEVVTGKKGAYMDPALKPGVAYSWRVRSRSADGLSSDYGDEVTLAMPAGGGTFSEDGLRLWLKADSLGEGATYSWNGESRLGYGGLAQYNPVTVRLDPEHGWPVVCFEKNARALHARLHGMVVDDPLMAGAVEGEILVVVKAAPGAAYNRLWETNYYPFLENRLEERFGSSAWRTMITGARLDEWNVYSVSAKDGEWVARLGTGELLRASENTVSFGGMFSLGGSFAGQVAELLVYDRVLQPAERESLIQSLEPNMPCGTCPRLRRQTLRQPRSRARRCCCHGTGGAARACATTSSAARARGIFRK